MKSFPFNEYVEKLVLLLFYFFYNYIFFEISTWILINMGSNYS